MALPKTPALVRGLCPWHTASALCSSHRSTDWGTCDHGPVEWLLGGGGQGRGRVKLGWKEVEQGEEQPQEGCGTGSGPHHHILDNWHRATLVYAGKKNDWKNLVLYELGCEKELSQHITESCTLHIKELLVVHQPLFGHSCFTGSSVLQNLCFW